MNTDHRSKPANKSKIWDRYWSVMFVGEHGQVVPFKRFKLLAVTIISALIVLALAVAVLAALLAHRTVQTRRLEAQINDSQKQLAQLRDEKDLLLTKMVIKKKQNDSEPQRQDTKKTPAPTMQEEATPPQTPVTPAALPKAPEKKDTPKPKPAVAAKLNADARRIKVAYQSNQKMLSVTFRVYNTSKPKVPLSGRTVVVFKNTDDPPIKWQAVPRVQLLDGKPTGKRGRAFKINNYRTVVHKAYNLKPPIRYNTATIFIFSSDGELLMTKDHGFKIEVPPAPKPVAPKPKPKPVIEKPAPKPAPTSPPATPSVPAPAPSTGLETSPPASEPTQQPAATPTVPGNQEKTSPSTAPNQDALPAPGTPSGPATTIEEAPPPAEPSSQGTAPQVDNQPQQAQPTNQGDQQ